MNPWASRKLTLDEALAESREYIRKATQERGKPNSVWSITQPSGERLIYLSWKEGDIAPERFEYHGATVERVYLHEAFFKEPANQKWVIKL